MICSVLGAFIVFLGFQSTPEKNKREEWMTELPPSHAVALGLGSIPRKFKTSEGPDMSDRTMWTDTPEDRLRKEKEKVRCFQINFILYSLDELFPYNCELKLKMIK